MRCQSSTRCNQSFTNEAKKQKPHKLPSKSILFSLVTIIAFLVCWKEKSGFLSYCALHHYKILVLSTNIFPVLGKFENCIVFAHFFHLMLKMKATVRSLGQNCVISFHFQGFSRCINFFEKNYRNNHYCTVDSNYTSYLQTVVEFSLFFTYITLWITVLDFSSTLFENYQNCLISVNLNFGIKMRLFHLIFVHCAEPHEYFTCCSLYQLCRAQQNHFLNATNHLLVSSSNYHPFVEFMTQPVMVVWRNVRKIACKARFRIFLGSFLPD